MQVTNNRVVHRSAALLGYGDNFRYQENIATSGWLAGGVAWFEAMLMFFSVHLWKLHDAPLPVGRVLA